MDNVVNKKSLVKLVALKKEYYTCNNPKRKSKIKRIVNNYIDSVINKDKRYFSKVSTYDFNNDDLAYLLQ